MGGLFKRDLRELGTVHFEGKCGYIVVSAFAQEHKDGVRLLITTHRNKLHESEVEFLESLDDAILWTPTQFEVFEELWQEVVVDRNRG